MNDQELLIFKEIAAAEKSLVQHPGEAQKASEVIAAWWLELADKFDAEELAHRVSACTEPMLVDARTRIMLSRPLAYFFHVCSSYSGKESGNYEDHEQPCRHKWEDVQAMTEQLIIIFDQL